MTETAPVAPDDTAALLDVYNKGFSQGMADAEPDDARIRGAISTQVRSGRRVGASAVARAVVPVGFTVVSTDDLRAVLDEFGWREMHYATADDFQAIYDRLRGKVGETE